MAHPRRSPVKWWRCLDKKALTVTVHTECGNCGATLMGPYCFDCGQHRHESARSVSALFEAAWHVASHVDGRFWQTLYILLFKPGKLTKEYFAERRARYLPPVRLYLVLSVLFFAFGLAGTPKINRAPPSVTPPSAAAPSNGLSDGAIDQMPKAKKKSRGAIFDIANCDDIHAPFTWLQDSLRQSCVRNKDDHGASIEHAFAANMPKMMFVFVPSDGAGDVDLVLAAAALLCGAFGVLHTHPCRSILAACDSSAAFLDRVLAGLARLQRMGLSDHHTL